MTPLPTLLKPSHPHHRAARKKIEAENPHFGIKDLALKAGILALMAGVALAPSIEHEAEHVAAHARGRIEDTRKQREQKRDSGGNEGVREGAGRGGKRTRGGDGDDEERKREKRGRGDGLRRAERERMLNREGEGEETRRRKEARPAPPLRIISQDFEAERQRYADRKARRMSDDEWDDRGRGRVHWR